MFSSNGGRPHAGRRLWPRFGWLSLLLGLCWTGLVAAQEEGVHFSCEPTELYRGSTLTVSVAMPHDGYDMSIANADSKPMIISFAPRPNDKIAPTIPAEDFAKMKKVKLVTTEARGSVVVWGKKSGDASTLQPPRLIFTKTGNYEVLIGKDLRSSDGEFDACYVFYFDCKAPKSVPEWARKHMAIPDAALHCESSTR